MGYKREQEADVQKGLMAAEPIEARVADASATVPLQVTNRRGKRGSTIKEKDLHEPDTPQSDNQQTQVSTAEKGPVAAPSTGSPPMQISPESMRPGAALPPRSGSKTKSKAARPVKTTIAEPLRNASSKDQDYPPPDRCPPRRAQSQSREVKPGTRKSRS